MKSALIAAILFGCREQTAAPTPAAPSSAPPPASTIAASSSAAASSATPSVAKSWSFDADTTTAGFSFGRTGDGRDGKWIVRSEKDAPSAPNVLAQTDADSTDYRFPVAFADAPSLRDVDLDVRCKPVSGKVDQACGLIFRVKDANNYYLTRANALENNVRLYFVKDGKRQQIASWNGTVSTNTWHELRAVAKDDHFEVYFDGSKVIDHRDKTFGDAGKVGVWTKADSVTLFDNLVVKQP